MNRNTGHWQTSYVPCQLRELGDMSEEGYRSPSCPAAENSASFFLQEEAPFFIIGL